MSSTIDIAAPYRTKRPGAFLLSFPLVLMAVWLLVAPRHTAVPHLHLPAGVAAPR